MTTKEFIYLGQEDSAMARAFNLSEEQVLDAYGGLAKYTQHRLDRDTARQAHIGNDMPGVPYLPQSPEEALGHYHLSDPKLTDAGLAREIIREQVEKVKGINQAVHANTALKEAAAKSKQDDQLRLESEARYLSRTYSDYSKDTEDECLARAIREIKSRRHAI